MDYLSNARKTRGKEEYYIVQSLQLQPLLCRPRDRRFANSGASFNRRGTVSGPSFNGRAPSRGPQVMIKQRLSTVVAAPCAGLAPSEHTNITLTYTHCRACPFVAVRNQRTINEHQFLTQPTCRDARSSVRKRRGAAPGPFTNVSKPHLLLGCLLAMHLAMRIKDASQPLRG